MKRRRHPTKLWLFGLFISLLILSSAQAAEVYFSPSPDCENKIVEAINESKSEIAAAVYSIGNEKIVAALITAKKRGVKVRVLTDSVQAAGRGSKAVYLKQSGIDLRLHSKHKIEHNKFGWFDGKTAINGSFNWTEPASKFNSENCVVFSETNVIEAFKKRFDELWLLNTEDKSKVKLAKIHTRTRDRVPTSELSSDQIKLKK